MAALTPSAQTVQQLAPNGGFRELIIITASTADSADTLDLTTYGVVTVYGVSAWDVTSADSVTCTCSGVTLTLDASGGSSDHVYCIRALVR